MLTFIKNKWFNYKYKSYTKEQALALVVTHGSYLRYLNDKFKNDSDIFLAAIQTSPQSFKYASAQLKNNRSLILQAITINPLVWFQLEPTPFTDKELALAAVSGYGLIIRILPENLKNDIDIGYATIKQNSGFLTDVGKKLQKNRIFVIDALRLGALLTDLDKSFENDESLPFIFYNLDSISDEQWPTIRQALIDNPSEFLHPPQVISDLLEENPDKFLILAQRALTNNVNTELMTNELEGIEL